ncbi:putative ABC transport system permease protein [Pseudarthrobacter oxydans]|uniref:ABC transport system permease protein n=1 Tax=Pseudarthrobacter oxydans TaxID=1671 RepID=A0AAW8NG66_PSEOX|nr:ABC transporter permease [Pseudarthrobacter oxydans]MDR7165725.1 putative ABC transport system permease protein [Pseudarthrobacter oxydans]
MKFQDIVASAVTNSFRSRLRTTLTVIAIFIGAFTLSITTAIGTGVSNYIDTQVSSLGSSDTMTVTRALEETTATDSGPAPYDPDAATGGGFGPGFGDPLTDNDIETIADIDGVMTVNPIVQVAPSFIAHDDGDRFQITVAPGPALPNPDLASGSALTSNDDASEILLPGSYLDALDLGDAEAAVGQTVTIGISDYLGEMHEVDATVAGILNESLFATGASLNQGLTDKLVEVQATGRPDSLPQRYFAATATFDTGANADDITALKDRLADEDFSGQTVADQIGAVQTVINGIIGVLNAFAVIALIAAGFGIVNTLLMSVQERTREIGLMKAMGMSSAKVFGLFSSEAVFIGFLGSALGVGVAIGLGSLLSNFLANTVLADLQGLQVLQFAPSSVTTIVLVVMGIAFLAGTLPARRAAKQNPIDALRYE